MGTASRSRRTPAAVTLFGPPVAVLASWPVWRDRLPARVAAHWSDLGTADGTLPAGALLTITLGGALVAALAGVVARCAAGGPGDGPGSSGPAPTRG